jgi:phosphate transport system substrate-binding protein
MEGKKAAWLARTLAGVAVLAFGAACGGDTGSGSSGTGTDLSGTVVISGSSTVEPISALVAELFAEQNPNVNISVDGPGTGDGFELFCAGETDVSDASRPIDPEEADACGAAGIEYIELPVAFDGITVMTNPANSSVACLTTADLYALIGPESKGFGSWSDANSLAADVGGTGGYPSAPLDIVGPGEESGTYDAFVELAGFEDLALERGVPEDQAATTRSDYQSSPNDTVIIQGIEGSQSSLGWVGYAFAEGAGAGVKVLGVDGGDGCVSPDRGTIADASYPLSRTLYIYVNKATATENAALRAYVDLYMSDAGLAGPNSAVVTVGYVELPSDQAGASRAAWDGVSA